MSEEPWTPERLEELVEKARHCVAAYDHALAADFTPPEGWAEIGVDNFEVNRAFFNLAPTLLAAWKLARATERFDAKSATTREEFEARVNLMHLLIAEFRKVAP